MQSSNGIDAYMSRFSKEVQAILQQVRQTIREAAPNAKESIKYGLPTFEWQGNLVHFGAFKNHIGFYPTPSGIKEFEEELSKYKGAKGSVQFPFGEPVPLDLIRRITLFRVAKNTNKTKPLLKNSNGLR